MNHWGPKVLVDRPGFLRVQVQVLPAHGRAKKHTHSKQAFVTLMRPPSTVTVFSSGRSLPSLLLAPHF
eukprot:3756931-Prymnesium_polylepis.1